MSIDLSRWYSRGRYDTDFSFLSNKDVYFPSLEVRQRNTVYRFREKQFNGLYAKNKRLIAMVDGVEKEIDYKLLSTNYYKLLTNKMSDLIFNNEVTIKTGSVDRDKKVTDLCNKTGWYNTIRKAFRLATIYGDSCIKTYVGGASAFAPLNCFKIVDVHNTNNILGYCMYEYLYTNTSDNKKVITHIRFEIHLKGKIFEIVKRYEGGNRYGQLKESVDFEYRGRKISKQGNLYNTGVDDCELIQWLSICTESDGVYGESLFSDIQDVVTALEQRLSSAYYSLNNLQNPFLVIGMNGIEQDQATGDFKLKLTNNNLLIRGSRDDVTPEYIAPDYKLESNELLMNDLRDLIYELSELSKPYLTGQYSGNPSEESINNLIKSAIDKGNRLITEMYDPIRDSLYMLCVLNGIDINKEDIAIDFNIGRTDDNLQVMNICEKAIQNRILSRATLREKYFGYNKEQSMAEDKQIDMENENSSEQYKNVDIQSNELTNNENEKTDNKIMEGITNEGN